MGGNRQNPFMHNYVDTEDIMNLYFNGQAQFEWHSTPFLNNVKMCNVIVPNFVVENSSGMAYKSQRNAILGGIGELLEREIMIPSKLWERRCPNNEIRAYSIVNKKEVKISLDYIISNYGTLIDSCGLASHTNSKDVIMNSFDEFIERQSYLFNYLSKSSGEIINLDRKDEYRCIRKQFPSLKFYNISLIKGFYVILGKGFENGNFYIGLGSSASIDLALQKCIKEIQQCNYAYKVNIRELQKKDFKELEYTDYSGIFFSLDPNKLKNAYNYLDEKSTSIYVEECPNYTFDLEELCIKLNEEYEMEPILVYLETLRCSKTVKTAKIIDLNWFKSLCIKFCDEDTFNYIEKATGKVLDRKCTFIPFP